MRTLSLLALVASLLSAGACTDRYGNTDYTSSALLGAGVGAAAGLAAGAAVDGSKGYGGYSGYGSSGYYYGGAYVRPAPRYYAWPAPRSYYRPYRALPPPRWYGRRYVPPPRYHHRRWHRHWR